MKANELMTGAFVYFNRFDGNKIVVRVTDFNSGIVFGDLKNNSHLCRIEKVEPIPLTPEILEKNGFVKESRENFGNNLQYCILTDGLWIDISGENFFEGKLEYVHQLQQAMHLCRIEKEIIL